MNVLRLGVSYIREWTVPFKCWSHAIAPWLSLLTQLLQDKMAAISQTIFSDAFSWMKSFVFSLKFHWGLFLNVQLTITQDWFRLVLNRRQAIIWTNADPINWRMYVALGGDELMCWRYQSLVLRHWCGDLIKVCNVCVLPVWQQTLTYNREFQNGGPYCNN